MPEPCDGELVHFRIYEFTNLRIYCGIGTLQKPRVRHAVRFAGISLSARGPSHFPNKMSGTRDALVCDMNPQAEALKKRTFKFGLQVVYFCRELRKTWEGDEFADQLFRAATRVGANYRSACRGRSHDDFVAKLGHAVEEADESVYWLELVIAAKTINSPMLNPLLAEANELWAILNQSQVTARMNQARRRGTKSPVPQLPQSNS